MALAALNNIEKTFGQRVLFDQLSFDIDRGERVGLIGSNGSGKSTLFNVLTGQMPIDSGSVSISKGAKLGMLSQDPILTPENSVIDEAELAFAELHHLSHRMRDLEHEMAHVQGDELEKVLEKYQDAQHQFEMAGGYAWRHRLEAALLGVGLPRIIWEQTVSTLSGGQRSRLALAKLLVGQNDLLLLDEPTNHLDLAAIAWLEDFLATFNGAVLIVSHDRYLLDRLATRIVWLTGAKLKNYPGNYSAFVSQRAVAELTQRRAHEEQQADIEKQAEFIRRFSAGQRAREAKGRAKRLERLLKSDAIVGAVASEKKIRLSLGADQRAGDRVLSVKELSKTYDAEPLWKDIKFEITRGERIGIIGPNGSGKTTMLEVLLGKRDADAGIVRWGASLAIGYYDQRLGDFDPENTVAEEVRGDREMSDASLRALLALMLFTGEDIHKPIQLLSGGERARVAMAQLLADRPNVLVLDEPTNHLDIASCEALEKALGDFDGTILCVSHDRYFLDKVVSRLLILQPPDVRDFAGNYSAWHKHEQASARNKVQVQSNPPAHRPSAPKKNAAKKSNANPWNRPHGRLTVPQLETEISQTERDLSKMQSQFADPQISKNPVRSRELTEKYDKSAKKLRELEEEYLSREQ